jgi:RimJ/RimL family protein N-acetyltransferase
VKTKDNFLLMIVEQVLGYPIGFVWLMIQQTASLRSLTLVNILIYDAFRSQGYGTQALQLVEEKGRALGLESITLHAFGHNQRARSLYERLGYRTTNVQMAKDLR